MSRVATTVSQHRIIFVNRYFYPDHSATSQLLADLTFDLSADGAEVHVVAGRQLYDDPKARLPTREKINGVEVHRIRATEFGRLRLMGRTLDYLGFYLSCAFKLIQVLRRGDIVIAKTDPPLISVVVGALSRIKRAQLVNWIQDLFPEAAEALGLLPRRAALFTTALRWCRNWSLRIARTNVVLGPGMAWRVSQCEPRGELTIIPNWALNETRPVAPARNNLRDEWGLNAKFVVGYSGNMGRAHELRIVLDAATALRDEGEVVFLFIGGGSQLPELRRLAADRRLENVLFRDYQSRDLLHLSLSLPDVHLVSLKPELEGFIVPSKFYGIAAAGRPTIYIGSENGDIAREVVDAECGLVVASDDTLSLTNAIRTLRDNAVSREQMGANARTLFQRRFTRRLALNKWREILAEGRNGCESRLATREKHQTFGKVDDRLTL